MIHSCRHCGTPLSESVLDLGHQPPSNSYLTSEQLCLPESTFPLELFVCTKCWLVQVPTSTRPEQLFTEDYAYLSSTSSSWCSHAKDFVNQAIKRLELTQKSYVLEIASNDGYLLEHFLSQEIPCTGIEPTGVAASVSRTKGIHTIQEFFGSNLSDKFKGTVDLVVANNVLAHVPDINDFMYGISNVLKNQGSASIEFQHLMSLLEFNQFDTIYHEHFSYLTLGFVKRLASSYHLKVYDVERLNTHGGSLRVWLTRDLNRQASPSVASIDRLEYDAVLESITSYRHFQARAVSAKHGLLKFLLEASERRKIVYGYGAAAKGNTLINFAGISKDLLPAVADKSPSKQGKYLPGSHIPVIKPSSLLNDNPDFLLVLPWNLIKEISTEYSNYDLVTAIPNLHIIKRSA